MYVCVYACMHACMHACMDVWMCLCLCLCLFRVCVSVCVCVRVCARARSVAFVAPGLSFVSGRRAVEAEAIGFGDETTFLLRGVRLTTLFGFREPVILASKTVHRKAICSAWRKP